MWRTIHTTRRPGRGSVVTHRPGTAPAAHDRPAAPAAEPLERRLLLSAADVDPSFGPGNNGIAHIPSLEIGLDVAGVEGLAGGKVLVGGSSFGDFGAETDGGFLLARLTDAGKPDTTFGGGDGIVLTDFPSDADFHAEVASAMAVGADGRITLAGSVNEFDRADDQGNFTSRGFRFALARYLADGTPDPSFGPGGSGRVVLNIPGGAAVVAALPGGKTYVAGSPQGTDDDPTFPNVGFALARLNANGTPDNTFGGGDGLVVITSVSGHTVDVPRSLAVDAAGRAILAGVVEGIVGRPTGVVRFLANGTGVDTTFSGDGLAAVPLERPSLAVVNGSNVLVSGNGVGTFADRFAITRLTSNGTTDAAFGAGGADGNGLVTTSFDDPSTDFVETAEAADLDVQPDGRILVAGTVPTFHPEEQPPATVDLDLAVARYNANGTPDLSFNNGSEKSITVLLAGEGERAQAVDVAPDGKILVAGNASGALFTDIIVVRRLGSPLGDPIVINGTTGSDRINVTQSGQTLTVNRNGQVSTIAIGGRTQLVVNGLGGDDALTLSNNVQLHATLNGGNGNDRLHGGNGRDDFNGGSGDDAVDYSDVFGVRVSLDDLRNDGPQRDENVHGDVEIVLGGPGDDFLTGNNAANLLAGGGGEDTLTGGGGRDVLIGGNNFDRLHGGAFDDLLIGSRTIYESSASTAPLRSILREWRRTDFSYAQRISRLLAGVSGVRISASTVVNDSADDHLTGGANRDWFVVHAGDVLADRAANETATQL